MWLGRAIPLPHLADHLAAVELMKFSSYHQLLANLTLLVGIFYTPGYYVSH